MKQTLLTFAFIICNYFTYGQTTHLGNDNFSYNGNTVYHYGLGWYSDPDAIAYGPVAYMSGFGGIKFFTGGGVRAVIDPFGNVGIGTTDPNGFKLAVNGGIRSKSVKVELANWPDFVFKKDYKLPTLTEVKAYIEKNRHLPDMPSAEEVHANGLDVGEMNRLLLKKVEELTLYLIEKDKQLNEQETKLHLLNDQLERQESARKQQENRLTSLEKMLKNPRSLNKKPSNK